MDEDSAVKAPVTRLRRKLSVEQSEDVKSPGPATPTKKRGVRLAAKPQLELIDENVPEPNSSAKRSNRKTSVKEIVEAAEEKPVTPSRRTTRIKSNTSLVSETLQNFDSPRAKRAARRTSQIGSDSESSMTPVRQTRRTRKDSTSSIEKLEVTLSGKPTQITEVIIEEDNNTVKSDDTAKGNDKKSNTPVRKSPRLKGQQQKKGRKSTEGSTNEIEVGRKSENNASINQEKQTTEIEQKNTDVLVGENVISPKKTNNTLVDSSLLLVKELDIKPNIKSSYLNKSTSALENHNSLKKKRQRTKSWTITLQTQDKDGAFFSDNEITKKKLKKRISKGLSIESNQTGSGDSENIDKNCIQNADIETQPELDISIQKNINFDKIHSCSKTRTSKEFISPNKTVNTENKSLVSEAISPQGNKENIIIQSSQDNLNESTKSFEKAFTSKVQSTVYFDDSDTDSKDKSAVKTRVDTEDQCVPVIHHLVEPNLKENSEMTQESAKEDDVDNSCEPMDIDETMPNNVSLSEYSQTNMNKSSDKFGDIHDPKPASTLPVMDNTPNKSLNKSKRKSSKSMGGDIPEQTTTICSKLDITLNESSNKSKRKSSDSKANNTHEQESTIGSPLTATTLNKSSSMSKLKLSDCKIEDIPDQTSTLCASLDNSLNKSSNKSKRKSSDNKTIDTQEDKSIISSLLLDTTLNKSSNNSKRKSSLSHSHNLEKSETENKTTLILSQIKDVSSTEDSISKSPKRANDILSKSVGSAGPTKESLDKKNLSHDYSTSTPLQQKKFQKLAMQINSSIIDSSNIEYKKEKVQNAAIKDMSQGSKKSETTSDDESDSELAEESSKDQSGILDDEAEEASDDYESGDSQDYEERKYQKENELEVRGETLESDDDVSNDSDYEKDSFVVSSDEEDNDLLSGSGDDLSMSDNELSMSKKSKKKYDERKQKEQKKASREMFEARHKLNTSDATTKANKLNKRQQIESSEESEEEEVMAPVKRNKHLRLDSTHEEDIDQSSANKFITKKNSKAKHLSESKHNESQIQETEISTACDTSVFDNDPLSVQIKLEPKTPLKDFNISTVQINENIEELQVDNNASVTNTNETMDPLQASTLAGEDSSLSENSEIANNYDSILKELNSVNKTKRSKTLDLSLNLNKKTKQNPTVPIIDQLNLTNTKTSKKKEKVLGEDAVHSAEVNRSQNEDKSAVSDAESSDSIDLHLLFSEDSNDNNEVVAETTKYEKCQETNADEFIPLKRTPGKMNILTSDDKNELSESTLNESTKKKNKKRISQKAYEESTGEPNDNQIHIIIDTQGTLNSKETRKSNSITENKAPLISTSVAATDKDDEAPLEVSYESTKRKKKNHKSSENNVESQDKTETSLNMSLSTNSAKKKKKRVSESHIESTEETGEAVVQVCNTSIESAKQEKNISKLQLTSADTVLGDYEEPLTNSKKRKRKSSANKLVDNASTEDPDLNPCSSKVSNEASPNVNQKKKRKISQSDYNVVPIIQDAVPKKKNKKRKERDDEEGNTVSKIFKENSFDKVHITKLPSSVLNQLEDKPRKRDLDLKRANLVSTTSFIVEDTRKRRNNPSKFLEESIYLNDTHIKEKPKGNIKKPKVLPFLPTAVTSGSGFTTNFKINVISQEVQFVAQTKNVTNFKNEYLYGKKIKRLGTYETYKKNRNAKLSKF